MFDISDLMSDDLSPEKMLIAVEKAMLAIEDMNSYEANYLIASLDALKHDLKIYIDGG